MFPRIAKARHQNGYCLELTFTNGAVHELDFARRVLGRGGVFRAVWPNGVDLCPDVLYALATDKAVESLEPA
jgi:hypothetical protein